MPGVRNEEFSISLAGIIGTSAVFIALIFIGKYLYAFEPKEE